jgi:radical SAM superfamily enzyme YgiQ (UPF0313 family)
MKKSDYSLQKRLTSAETDLYHAKGGEPAVGVLVPNPYKVGVVGLSSHILIRLAAESGAAIERIYSDNARNGLRAWASGKQASELDILLCSVSYEPDLLVLAKMLRQGGISPLASGRRSDDPIVMVGGVAVMGAPQLASQIGDVVAWGEAEVILPALLDKLKEHKGKDRSEIINELTMLAGVKTGNREINPNDAWHFYPAFADNPGYSVILTPYSEFGSSFLVELARGCPHGCRHCLACRAQSPFRPARSKSVVELTINCGVEKIGLVGLGVASHPHLQFILESLYKMKKKISTASLTAEDLSFESMSLIAAMGQRTLTLSPEAGSESLRQSIGKMAAESQWMKVAGDAWKVGFKAMRLYFMAGLPQETENDLRSIPRFVTRIATEFKGRIAATITPFIPKPHTPWQHLIPLGETEWARRLGIIRSNLTRCTVRVESPRQAMQQWQLSRLDAEDAKVLLTKQLGKLND